MGKKRVVKLESSRVSKVKKETERKPSGSSPSGIKREHEDSDGENDDHTPKRMRRLDPTLELELTSQLSLSLAAIRNYFQAKTSTPSTPQTYEQIKLLSKPQQLIFNYQQGCMTSIISRGEDPVPIAMSIFQIRRTIFKHLPVSSLLQFALVSKDWYEETRSVLEKFKTCAAFIPGHQPCVDLLHLNNEIPWMTRIPFNCLKLQVFLGHQPCVICYEKTDMEKLLGNILNLPLKSLEINRNRWMGSYCLASAVLREAFRGRYPTIEKMILPLLPPMKAYPPAEYILKEKPIPNLKYLEFRLHESSSKPLFLLALQVAPNIQEILTPLEVSSSKNELESLTSTQLTFVKWILLQPVTSVRPEVVRLMNFSCGLRRLEVTEPVGDMRADRSWMMTVNQLLECSTSTLEYLSVANHEIMLRLDRTVKPFPSLKYFQISIASMTDQLPAILSRFRLGQLFPNLIGLRIFFNQLSAEQAADLDTTLDSFQGFENDGNSQLWPPITRLEFHVSPARSFSYGIFDHFAQKCPQITEFVYQGLGDKFLNYQIFTCFPHLKRLKLVMTANHVSSLDEFLCGLDAEDVKDLVELPLEKLKKFHVVPRRHNISNLTDLQQFKLVISGAEKLRDNRAKQKCVVSHVTGVLIFSRWPSMEVEINCRHGNTRYTACHTLDLLRPYAKVYITRF